MNGSYFVNEQTAFDGAATTFTETAFKISVKGLIWVTHPSSFGWPKRRGSLIRQDIRDIARLGLS